MKHIYFIRHGRSNFNEQCNDVDVGTFLDIVDFDTSLSEIGMQQTKLLKDKFDKLEYDLIITSPLRRALQTLQNLLFNNSNITQYNSEGANYNIIALPQLRELTENSCDIGSDINVLKTEFPFVDFGLVDINTTNNNGDLYDWNNNFSTISQTKIFPYLLSGYREPIQSVHNRIIDLFKFISQRKEKNIVLIGHVIIFKEIFDIYTKNAQIYHALWDSNNFLNNINNNFSDIKSHFKLIN